MNEIKNRFGAGWVVYLAALSIVAYLFSGIMLTVALSLVSEHGVMQMHYAIEALQAGRMSSLEYSGKITEISDNGLRMMAIFTAVNFIAVTAFFLSVRTMGKYSVALEAKVKELSGK